MIHFSASSPSNAVVAGSVLDTFGIVVTSYLRPGNQMRSR